MFLQTSNWERRLGGQWVKNERGLAVGWAVWRRSYLNRNASAAFSGGAGWRTRRIAESYAGDRDMEIHDGKDASFCRSCRFVCPFIAHLPPFLPTSIILVQLFFFFSSYNICFSSHFSSLLRMFPYSPAFTEQLSNSSKSLSSFAFCGGHRRTEIHATASCACFVGPDHALFGGCIGSALNNVSILPHPLDANSKSRSTLQSTSVRHSFLVTVLLFTPSMLASMPP